MCSPLGVNAPRTALAFKRPWSRGEGQSPLFSPWAARVNVGPAPGFHPQGQARWGQPWVRLSNRSMPETRPGATKIRAFVGLVERNMEFQCDRTGLIRFDIGRPNHLGPFFRFLNDKLAEIVGRARHLDAAQIGNPRFHIRID